MFKLKCDDGTVYNVRRTAGKGRNRAEQMEDDGVHDTKRLASVSDACTYDFSVRPLEVPSYVRADGGVQVR